MTSTIEEAGIVIIAEIGINHNGNVHLAHELIRQAAIAGATIAKFQFYDPYKLFGPSGTHPDDTAFQFALSVQFGYDEAKTLKRWCEEEGIEFMASVFDAERFEWTESLDVARYKIASRTVQDTELCHRILATGKETFISLGAWHNKEGLPYLVANAHYLYCVMKYPCEYSDIRLPTSFRDSRYDGFSDHTIGLEASLVAIGRGAMVIEKHFTLSKGLEGPDHACSATPTELADLCRCAKLMQKIV